MWRNRGSDSPEPLGSRADPTTGEGPVRGHDRRGAGTGPPPVCPPPLLTSLHLVEPHVPWAMCHLSSMEA